MPFFDMLLIIYLCYVIINEILYVTSVSREMEFLDDFDEFLSHVRHYYYYTGSCEDAVFYSIPKCKRRIMPVLLQISACLESGTEEGNIVYAASDMNKFTKLFVSLALMVSDNGDSEMAGSSVFLQSIMQLRSDIQDEKRFMENRKHRFTGLGLTAALPIVAVPFIARWGSETIPSLMRFYYGRTGNILLCLILFVTLLCYRGVCNLRTDGHPNEITVKFWNKVEVPGVVRKLSEKVRIFSAVRWRRSVALFTLVTILMVPILAAGHSKGARLLMRDVSDIENVTDSADGRQLQAMKKVIPQYVFTIINSDEKNLPDREAMIACLLEEEGIRTESVACDTADEILRRVTAIRNERFGPEDILLVFLAGGIAAMMPMFLEKCNSLLTNSRKQDEIIQFQSLIHMQKNVPGISTVDILESMENFSDVFRPGLQQCINEFCVNDTEALNNLAASETYPDFLKLTDCFLAVDEAGVEAAFDEVSEEITNFKENRRLTRAIMLDNNALLGSLLSIIPGGLILFGYLLVPFMVRSISMFNAYQETLGDYINSSAG